MQGGARELEIPEGEATPLLERARAMGAPVPPPGEPIRLDDYFRLLRRLSDASGEETFALTSRPMKRGSAEFALMHTAGARDLGEAMERLAEAYNLMHGGDYNRVERQGSLFAYRIADESYPYYTRARDDFLHMTLECALIFVHGALCELAREDLSPRLRRVATRRAGEEGEGRQALAFFSSPVACGADAYALCYDAGVATLPVRRAPGAPGAYLAVHNRILAMIEARRAGVGGGIVARVTKLLADGVREQEAVAARLGLSVATLRRRLGEAGTGFRDLRHEAMNVYAQRRLSQTADVGQVAEELGFSDPRAFTRAFKAWNGATPTGWLRGDERTA